MKTQTFSSFLSPLVAALTLTVLSTACTPKGVPASNHKGPITFSPREAPRDESVETKDFTSFNIGNAYAEVKANKADMSAKVLAPLSKLLLNEKFLENPDLRGTRLSQMIHVFNQGFLARLEQKDASAEFAKIKEAYLATVTAGCSRDLRQDCKFAAIFTSDARHMRVMTLLATHDDVKLEALLKASKSPDLCVSEQPECRGLLEERYRLLTLAFSGKRNRVADQDFSFAYMKFARAYASFLAFEKAEQLKLASSARGFALGYIHETHGRIFETLVAKYKPADINSPEVKSFVENFNPWGYSRSEADLFQHGTRTMFEIGAKCCLYEDAGKTKPSEAVIKAIRGSQAKKEDSSGETFREMIAFVEKRHGELGKTNRLFANLGVEKIISRAKIIEANGDLQINPEFYDEFFLIVDRVFRGHLSTADVEMVLRSANPQRARLALPKMVVDYAKINLIYLVVKTNEYMTELYASNEIASNEVFEAATARSREISAKWFKVQSQIDLLQSLMESYARTQGLENDDAFKSAAKTLVSVNRNIHYVSVYPNMIMMTYFLSKMKGTIEFKTWWGAFKISADTILDLFFDGSIDQPWFRFGKDPETLRRETLLFAFEYLMSTEALNTFQSKDGQGVANGQSERSKFLELVLTKYLDADVRELRKAVVQYERDTVGNPIFESAKEFCRYEGSETIGLAPRRELDFLELDRYTYTGLGNNSVNAVLTRVLDGGYDAAMLLRKKMDYRLTYVQTLLDLVEADLIRSEKIKQAGDKHPDTVAIYKLLGELRDLKGQVYERFVPSHKEYFECIQNLQDIERRRANRLYEEERAYLGQVYDMIEKSVAPHATGNDAANSPALTKAAAEITQNFFRGQQKANFDKLDGLNFKMSQYDLLMRMKNRIEADIFMQPTEKERQVYGASLKRYLRPRPVSVFMPPGLERSSMMSNGTNISIVYRGNREEFIQQGMSALNGTSTAFVQWQGQMSDDKSLGNYIRTLQELYLAGPVTYKGQTYEVKASDITRAYVKTYASFTMDEFDERNALDFKIDGRFKKEFYEGTFFDRDGQTRLPFFYSLMDNMYSYSKVSIEEPGEVLEALEFARRLNTLDTFVFEPKTVELEVNGKKKPQYVVNQIVAKRYGDRAHATLKRMNEMFGHLKDLETKASDVTDLDSRFARPFYLESGRKVIWRNSSKGDAQRAAEQNDVKFLVDNQRIENLRINLEWFKQNTNDFYNTRKEIPAK